MRAFLPLLAVLLVVAFFTKIDAFFYLVYSLFGIFVIGRLWARRSLAAVSLRRVHDHRVFLDRPFTVDVEVRNGSWLPVLWMRLGDSVPAELSRGNVFRRVISLMPRETLSLSYELSGRQRGYYALGPFNTLGGDLMGTLEYEASSNGKSHVIVYPKIVPLEDLGLPSQSPFGTLPWLDPILEDPTRIQGVRDYQPGDSLRRMDWKTSARVGSLQVRRFEPAIALETAIFLNLDPRDYASAAKKHATELGIVVAASAAVHLVGKRQSVALGINGRDPLADEPNSASYLPLRKGQAHLMNLLDILARIELPPESEAVPFLQLLSRRSQALPWGSTVLVVTSREVEGLLSSILSLRRRGLLIVLALTSPEGSYEPTARRAAHIGVQTVRIESEQGLDVWR
jgi:uncharacterized protein (DUF58 family)